MEPNVDYRHYYLEAIKNKTNSGLIRIVKPQLQAVLTVPSEKIDSFTQEVNSDGFLYRLGNMNSIGDKPFTLMMIQGARSNDPQREIWECIGIDLGEIYDC